MKKTKIGIVGCGTIGLEVAKAIETRLKNKAVLVAISDIDEIKIDNLLSKIKARPDVCSLKELIKKSDFVVEAASAVVSAGIAKKALAANKDVLIMSVGGLLNVSDIFNAAQKTKARLYIPSGALAGLDALKSAVASGLRKLTLTTRKSPRSLEGAPYLKENNIDLSSTKQETVLFEGTAAQAIKGFPKNVNVAVALSLIYPLLNVKIIVVPQLKSNIHEIEAEGGFGKMFTRTENMPSPNNPKTSYLAALSAIATLEGALSNVKIGT